MHRSIPRAAVLVVAAASALLALGGAGDAGVHSTTELAAYRVGGTTAAGLVAYMRRYPFHGDRGAAGANIRPHYVLSADLDARDGVCRVSDIDLDIRFVMTLPEARTPEAFSPATRAAWSGFTDFARRHEETHRAIYLQCADELAATLLPLTASRCTALRARIEAMLDAAKRNCEARQLAFDRRDARKVFGLALFMSAQSWAGRHSPAR